MLSYVYTPNLTFASKQTDKCFDIRLFNKRKGLNYSIQTHYNIDWKLCLQFNDFTRFEVDNPLAEIAGIVTDTFQIHKYLEIFFGSEGSIWILRTPSTVMA